MEHRYKIRPYARLLTMLGEQLITNEQIALAELIKNAYDADADWVKISFENFEIVKDQDEFKLTPQSKIIIEDNGCGMDLETIQNSWMNPATPNKKSKDNEVRKTPKKHRIIQGEKGIGRFAILKLGRDIKIITRPEDCDTEYYVDYNLSAYDDDFLTKEGEQQELYIDNIEIAVNEREPQAIVKRSIIVNSQSFDSNNNHGTRIEITNLKGSWTEKKIDEVGEESQKLESIFDKITKKTSLSQIEIGFELNGERKVFSKTAIDKLADLLENSAVFKITDGYYNEKESVFTYKLNGIAYRLPLSDLQIAGLAYFKKRFMQNTDLFGNPIIQETTCGDFKFNFFVFDFIADKETPYYLDKTEKERIKNHRIYLYRDGIRVAPYGNPDNDWLQIDKQRGIGRTGDYLSNDQVVGFVDISKHGNPRLKDKTNREGLIEEGKATQDFIGLIHSFLLYVRQHPYKQYQERVKQQKEQKNAKLRIVENKFVSLQEAIRGNREAEAIYKDLFSSYKIEQDFYKNRLDSTEDLAAVGLSVETASHDMSMMLNKGIDAIDQLVEDIDGGLLTDEQIENELHSIRGIFSFVRDRMGDIQLLFKSSKQKRRNIRFADVLEKVEKIYSRTFKRENINYNVIKRGSPIIAKCTDAVILQLLINLFDNAIYWLAMPDITEKKITITLDGDNQQVIFSDNGPGIREDDKPFIFEAFYSGKEDGRGLGLYIARQLLQRMGYSISLAEIESEKVLSGANFVINFVKSDEND